MSIARRLSVLAAAGALGLTLAPSAAEGQAGTWRVTDWSEAAPVSIGPVAVSGTVHHESPLPGRISAVTLTLASAEETEVPGCTDEGHETDGLRGVDTESDPPPEGAPADPEGTYTFRFSITVMPRCNGVYTADVVATFDPDGDFAEHSSPAMRQVRPAEESPEEGAEVPDPEVRHVVAGPPPPVVSITSTIDEARAVHLVWDPPEGYGTRTDCVAEAPADHPDFTGYLVQRETSDGVFTTLEGGTVPVGQQCLVEQLPADLPDGTYRYRVLSTRSSPNGTVTATDASSPVVAVRLGPEESAPTTAVRPPSSSRIISSGRTRPGGGASAATVPAPIDDGTYEEELDYGEPGEEAAVLPEDADSFLDFVPSPGEGILVPFAIAECLAVWALHLRYLARRADDAYLTPERTLE